MTPIGLVALARWQLTVTTRAIFFAPLFWVGWMAFWTVVEGPNT